MDNQKSYKIDLKFLFLELLHRVWIIILAAILCGAIGYGYAKLSTPVYRSRVSIMVNNTYAVDTGVISTGEIAVATHLAQTYIILVKSETILNDVIDTTGYPYTAAQLRGMVSAAVVNDTEIFEIYVTGPDPVETSTIANAFLEVMPGRVREIVEGSSLKTVDRATHPGSQISPNISRTTTMGAMFGVLLSVVIILLFVLFNDTITDEDYLLETYDLPVLAAIPNLSEAKSPHRYGYYK